MTLPLSDLTLLACGERLEGSTSLTTVFDRLDRLGFEQLVEHERRPSALQQPVDEQRDSGAARTEITTDPGQAVAWKGQPARPRELALESLQTWARVEAVEEKRSPLDFVLWKKAKPGEPTVGLAVGTRADPAGTPSAW